MIIDSANPKFLSALDGLSHNTYWQSSLYQRSTIDWIKESHPSFATPAVDVSFAVVQNDKPAFVFIGYRQDTGNSVLVSTYQYPSISLQTDFLSRNTKKAILKELDDRVGDSADVHYRDYLQDGLLSIVSEYLLEKGATAKPAFSSVIDLSADIDQIKRGLRKSYKSLINWGNREIKPKLIQHDSVDGEILDDFRRLHARVSGRETRTLDSWNKQLEMVRLKDAFLVYGHLNNELVSAGFFICSNDHLYYGSSASRRDLFEKPMFHTLMWSALEHAKAQGIKWFEVGDQVFCNHPQSPQPTPKEISISNFKSGFGGNAKTYLDISLSGRCQTK